jgi:kinetochore protein Nuf2
MTYNVSTDKATLASYQRKGVELGKRMEVISALEHDVRGLIDLAKGVETQRAKVDEVRRGMLALRERLESKNIESQGLVSRTAQLQRQLENASSRHQRSGQLHAEMREKADAKIQALKADYLAASRERGVWAKQREHLETEQRELEEEMKAFVARHEAELQEVMNEYWTMRRQAGEWGCVGCAGSELMDRGLHAHHDGTAGSDDSMREVGMQEFRVSRTDGAPRFVMYSM